LRTRPTNAVVLIEDEVLLRWFPPLRFAWAVRGTQAAVPITGRNAKRVLFGAINARTGHRIVLRARSLRQAAFQVFLREVRRRYPARPLWMVLDEGPAHVAAASQQLAARLDIVLLWLPKQCSELNPMDHLWRELKRTIAANRQFATVDRLARYAQRWLLSLTNTEAQRKAGMRAQRYWLRKV
jgi:transposase